MLKTCLKKGGIQRKGNLQRKDLEEGEICMKVTRDRMKEMFENNQCVATLVNVFLFVY